MKPDIDSLKLAMELIRSGESHYSEIVSIGGNPLRFYKITVEETDERPAEGSVTRGFRTDHSLLSPRCEERHALLSSRPQPRTNVQRCPKCGQSIE